MGASDWGSRTKGVLNEGIELNTAGSASIDLWPLAKPDVKVYHSRISESRNGVNPFPSG